ncbi:hypothetical protein KGQ34_04085, partial [Patescibacteria group bacterium]|nr:hypothetical protein [Patescibacteria group bacterium]
MRMMRTPFREYAIIAIIAVLLAIDFLLFRIAPVLFFAALFGALPTFFEAVRAIGEKRIRI